MMHDEIYDRYRAWQEYRRWQLMFAGQFGRIGWTYSPVQS